MTVWKWLFIDALRNTEHLNIMHIFYGIFLALIFAFGKIKNKNRYFLFEFQNDVWISLWNRLIDSISNVWWLNAKGIIDRTLEEKPQHPATIYLWLQNKHFKWETNFAIFFAEALNGIRWNQPKHTHSECGTQYQQRETPTNHIDYEKMYELLAHEFLGSVGK